MSTEFNLYTSKKFQLNLDYKGEAATTPISSNQNTVNNKVVLFAHDFIDYFLQANFGIQFNPKGAFPKAILLDAEGNILGNSSTNPVKPEAFISEINKIISPK
jgi:hypothetical protein